MRPDIATGAAFPDYEPPVIPPFHGRNERASALPSAA
jgi:hypothetical protein